MGDADEPRTPPRAVGGVERPISILGAVGWTVLFIVIEIFAQSITEAARPGSQYDLVNWTACVVLAASIVIFIMMRVYAPHGSVRETLGLRAVSPLHVLLSAVSGAAVYPALSVVESWLQKKMPVPEQVVHEQAKLLATPGLSQRVFLVVAFVILIPAAYEIFYRGALFGGIRKGRSAGAALLVTTGLFAFSHLDPRALVSLAVISMIAGWLRGHGGSTWSSFAAHAAYWAVPALPILRGGDPLVDVMYPPLWSFGGLAVAAVALGLARIVASRDARSLRARMSDD
jgi:membrane protease YdiL (CAAX protease family)